MHHASVFVLKFALMLGLFGGIFVLPAKADSEPKQFQRAHMAQAVTYLEENNYDSSYQQFYELMQLGNGQAAAQLGMMTLNEQGTSYDPVRAWSYFTLASNLGYSEGSDLADQVYAQLSESEQAATSAAIDQLERSIVITVRDRLDYRHYPENRADLVTDERGHPRYPRRSSRRGQVGFVEMRILVNTDGSIAALHSHFYTHPDFRREAERVAQSWSYEPIDQPRVGLVRLDFSMGRDESRTAQPYIDVIRDSLWESAQGGSPAMQAAQGVFLHRILPLHPQQIDYERVAEHPPELDDINAARDSEQVPLNWSALYWLNRAASAGERSAQQVMAHRHQEWRDYLIAAGDSDEMAWEAAELLTHDEVGQRRGLQLYQHLQASDDLSESTTQLLEALGPHYEAL